MTSKHSLRVFDLQMFSGEKTYSFKYMAINVKFTIQYMSAVTGTPVQLQLVELQLEQELLEH